MINSPETNPLNSFYSDLKTNLEKEDYLTSGQIKGVVDWYGVLTRLFDEGYGATYADLTYNLTGREALVVPDDIEALPRVDGKATDADLGLGSTTVSQTVILVRTLASEPTKEVIRPNIHAA